MLCCDMLTLGVCLAALSGWHSNPPLQRPPARLACCPPPPPPAEGSDDDFEAPTAPRGSAPPSGTQGAASQAAAPERRGPNKYVKALDRGVQEQVYLYISSRLGVSGGRWCCRKFAECRGG